MRADNSHLYVTEEEMAKILELRGDGKALTEYLGPGICDILPPTLPPDPVRDLVAPWLRGSTGLRIVVDQERAR